MNSIKYRNAFFLLIPFWVLLIVGCYKDKGNYSYTELPAKVMIDTLSYPSRLEVVMGEMLEIDPAITYDGDMGDLDFEWQIWKTDAAKYVTVLKGKKLQYKCGPDEFIPVTGTYLFYLAVTNKKLKADTANPQASQVYSKPISVKVVRASFKGLMVLHGDGTQSDIGLIQDDIFLPEDGQSIVKNVNPGFYSASNEGQKIAGIGSQVVKVGFVEVGRFGDIGSSSIYAFTNQGGVSADYVFMGNKGTYASLFYDRSFASGKPEVFAQYGQGSKAAMIDNGRLFYGEFIAPLYNDAFSYHAAPFISLVPDYVTNRGAFIFDTQSKAFLYCPYNDGTTDIYRLPASQVSGVALEPADMKAEMIYMESLSQFMSNTLAVMKDDASGNLYLAEFDFWANELGKVSVGRFPMQNLPSVSSAKHYAFGIYGACYYGTDRTVYLYDYKNSNNASPAISFPAGEEISMMKIIKYADEYTDYYQYSNRMMVVGTVDAQGNGKLYAYLINTVTAALTQVGVYDGFKKIYSADIKDQ